MTTAEKRQFVIDIMAMVQNNILAHVDEMPEEWDVGELRHFVADSFADQTWTMDSSLARRYHCYNEWRLASRPMLRNVRETWHERETAGRP